MAHAEKCPVCGGEGTVTKMVNTTAGVEVETCKGCGGKGWVEVSDAPSENNTTHFITNMQGEDVHDKPAGVAYKT